ncbi:MAG: preprotein translocase subunit YajC [Bdellovibrionales bacterium]
MFISKAYAQAEMIAADIASEAPVVDAPSAGEAFMMNMALIGVLVLLFYVLMIRPQQKRMKEHTNMLSELKKGTKIVTQGGVVATVDKILNDHEMSIKVEGTTLVILRSAVMSTYAEAVPSAANDDVKAKPEEKKATKAKSTKSTAKKTKK